MPNYKQNNISGITYTRANSVTIANPLEGLKNISFTEEEITEINGTTSKKTIGILTEFLTTDNKDEAFDVFNPIDDSIIASSTYGQVYALLYSLYRHIAHKRDISSDTIAAAGIVLGNYPSIDEANLAMSGRSEPKNQLFVRAGLKSTYDLVWLRDN